MKGNGMIYKLVQHEEFVVKVIKCINKIASPMAVI
jgi:hypothetical protein